jgi:hypothetical protein
VLSPQPRKSIRASNGAGGRPKRTRAHYIADLSINYVERFILLCGHTAEATRHDYGCDLVMSTYDYGQARSFAAGEIENGQVYLQVKATDRVTVSADGERISTVVRTGHLKSWIEEPMPVILVLYDVAAEKAYWLYLQQHLRQSNKPIRLAERKQVTLHLPTVNVLNERAIADFRSFKAAVLAEIEAKCDLHA